MIKKQINLINYLKMIKILEVNSMNREKDLKKYNIRTDLLVESIKDNINKITSKHSSKDLTL